MQRVGEIAQQPCHLRGRQPKLTVEPLAEALARHVVHHVVEKSGGFAGGVNRDDAGVTETRDHARLRQEALGDRGMYREIGVHHLHRHRAIKRGVTGEEDDAHPAMPQLALEPILRPEGRLEAGGKLVRTGHGSLPMSRLGPGYRTHRGVGCRDRIL
jgi:hypothetical protein